MLIKTTRDLRLLTTFWLMIGTLSTFAFVLICLLSYPRSPRLPLVSKRPETGFLKLLALAVVSKAKASSRRGKHRPRSINKLLTTVTKAKNLARRSFGDDPSGFLNAVRVHNKVAQAVKKSTTCL